MNEIRRGKNRLKRIGSLLKEIEKYSPDPEKNAFVLGDRLGAVKSLLADLEMKVNLVSKLKELTSILSPKVDEAFVRAKTAVASGLARELGKKGFELSGNFPRLSCGLLTLEFHFESGGKADIYFGARIEKLKQVPVQIESITEAIFSIYESLDGTRFDEEEHLDLLFRAYRNTLQLLGSDMGAAVPISNIVLQTSILKQGKKFLADPVKSSYTSYGRVRFAYDLSRTKVRSVSGHELHLTVASMEQTKKSESHIWIPQSPRTLKGTHFSMLSFKRISG